MIFAQPIKDISALNKSVCQPYDFRQLFYFINELTHIQRVEFSRFKIDKIKNKNTMKDKNQHKILKVYIFLLFNSHCEISNLFD
ncbi:hypothetical protein, partial [Vibrio sp. V26_P1S5P106]|uniref:hypothetical protein n=1 Tax=Vibrio sp. V26_P1S5P106 TaxID=1938678 RepID=UPI001F314129